MLHNLFIWFVIILVHKMVHWTYLKSSWSSPFLGVFSILGLWREVEAKCVTLNSNVDLFSLQIHRNHHQCKKIHHHHSKKIHHWGNRGHKDIRAVPVTTQIFSHGSFSLTLGDGVDSKSSVRQMAICGGEGCFSSVASVCTTVPKLD